MQRPSISGEGHRENLGKTPELKGVSGCRKKTSWLRNDVSSEKNPGSFFDVVFVFGEIFLLEKTWECFDVVFVFGVIWRCVRIMKALSLLVVS